jgi:hypothetical protein
MKRTIFVILVAVLLAIPAFAEWRIDAGVIVPRGVGATIGGETQTTDAETLMNWPFIPIPDAGFYYVGEAGPVRLGIGARAFSALVETVVWPNALLEIAAGPVTIEAQMGGGLFAMFGILGSQFETGKVFIPDVSAWFNLGKKKIFRLGGGLIGAYMPELLGDGIPFLIYFGGKVAVPL